MRVFFFFNDTATTEIYTLSLHDALPICGVRQHGPSAQRLLDRGGEVGLVLVAELVREPREHLGGAGQALERPGERSEEHTSELQSRQYLVCRLLLEKKKKNRQLVRTKSD